MWPHMVKRAIIDMSGVNNKFRISRKGVSVDSAGPADFLVHEDYLVAQPYSFQFIPCSFAHVTGYSSNFLREYAPFTLPDVGEPDPIIIVHMKTADDFNIFPPQKRSRGFVGVGSFYHIEAAYTLHSPTSGDIRFVKYGSSQVAPKGAYVIAYRRAN